MIALEIRNSGDYNSSIILVIKFYELGNFRNKVLIRVRDCNIYMLSHECSKTVLNIVKVVSGIF